MTLKTRVNIAAVISILFVAVTLLIFSKFIENSVEIRFQEASLTGKTALWKKIITNQFDHMEANTSSISRDSTTLKALQAGDKALLKENAETTYNMLSTSGIISKLQITNLEGEVLYSSPDNFEGYTSKVLPAIAFKEGKIVRGVERDDDNKLYLNLAFPVYVRGKPVGVVIFMRDLQHAIEDFKLNDNSDTFIIDAKGGHEYTTDVDLQKQLEYDLPSLGSEAMSISKFGNKVYSIAIQPLLSVDQNALAHIVSAKDHTESYHKQQSFSLFSYLSIIATLLISVGGVTWYLSKNFKPLNTVVEMMNRISRGDLTNRTEKIKSMDEIGQLINAMNTMTDNFRRIVGEVYTATDNIDHTSHEISTGNTNLSKRTQEQTASLEETAASMEEMTGTVRHNAESTQLANQLANTTRDNAENGKQIVNRTINAMSEINDSSNRIADITSTIDGIAFQTNLLALNAAVEAARAGEEGRGFAVVASEVRSLAKRSADAAREIKGLIEDSVTKIKVGTDLVDESGHTLSNIVEDINKVAELIAEIDISSKQQASGIDQINNAVTQMDSMTQENVDLVDASTAANQLLQNQATRLTGLMEFFQLDQTSSKVTGDNHQLANASDYLANNEEL